MATVQQVQTQPNYNAVKIDINNPQVKVPQEKCECPACECAPCEACTAPIYDYPKTSIYDVPKADEAKKEETTTQK